MIDDRLTAHLSAWLGRWPGGGAGLTVVGWHGRDEPGWDGGLHRVIGVTAPASGVLSVPPAVAAAAAAWIDSGGAPAQIPAVAGLPGTWFDGTWFDGTWFDGVFRWSDRPAPLPDAGMWIAADHPSVPPWLRRFGSEVLVAVDEVSGEHLAGVGIKEHDVHGRELAVVTAEAVRGRGLARRLVAQAARRVLDEGAVPTYVHARGNTASARVAAAAGFPDRGWSFLAVDPQ